MWLPSRGPSLSLRLWSGGDADPVKLDVPAATRTLYVSCRTESGVSPQVAVPVTSDGAFCSLDPKAASGTRAGIGNDDEASVDEGLIYIPPAGTDGAR